MHSTSTGVLRLAAALLLVGSLVAAGYLSRSPWIVALAAPALTLLYALGKLPQWRLAWRLGGLPGLALALATTLPLQLIVGLVFYLIGLGLGRLFAPAPIAALGLADGIGLVAVFLACLACSLAILVLERSSPEAATAQDSTAAATPEPELDIDPTPVTPQTFFQSPGYWRPDAARQAMEGRGARVTRKPLAATDADIAAAEQRLGLALPESLRALYRIMDGGYVGALYVARTQDPRPLYQDWRGVFSIDYSSLYSLQELRTVRTHYEDFTDDPDDFPANADTLLILQARYDDMTLLDYSQPGEPRVAIVDFERHGDEPEITFATFAAFFHALRRPSREPVKPFQRALYRSKPLASLAEAQRGSAFWSDNVHPFVNQAKARNDGWQPGDAADAAMIAATEHRLGVKLPAVVKALWTAKNGGIARYIYQDGPDGDWQAFEELAPLEYFATLHELSQRIDFPAGETPWHEAIADTQKLVVLNAQRDALVLLDYRHGESPALLLVNEFGEHGLDRSRRFDDLAAFFGALQKFERSPLLP